MRELELRLMVLELEYRLVYSQISKRPFSQNRCQMKRIMLISESLSILIDTRVGNEEPDRVITESYRLR